MGDNYKGLTLQDSYFLEQNLLFKPFSEDVTYTQISKLHMTTMPARYHQPILLTDANFVCQAITANCSISLRIRHCVLNNLKCYYGSNV